MKVKTITQLQEDYQEKKKSPKHQDESFSSLPLSNYLNCVGVLRGEWFSLSDSKKLETICYGTAVALSKRVILTCAHSLYNEAKKRICSSVSFVLNQQQGIMKQSEKVYKSADGNFIKLEQLNKLQTFSNKAIPEELALVYLSEDLPLDDFPDIGLDVSLNSKQVSVNSSLFLSGHPSSQYFNKVDLRNIKYSRIDLKGNLKGMDINSSTLYHNLDTKTGHSGSAIFARSTETQKPTIIGIHTHKGRFNNSGILLTEPLLKRLASYDLFFAFKHPQYDASIKLPLDIRTAAFEELSIQNQDFISQKSLNYQFNQQGNSEYSDDEHSEMDFSIFEVQSPQQILKLDQELIHQDNSIKITSSKLTKYCSIEEYEVQNYQEKQIDSGFEQTVSMGERSEVISFIYKQMKENLDKTYYFIREQTSLQMTNIEQFSQYFQRINPQEYQQLKHTYKELVIETPQNNNIIAWEQFYSSVYSQNKPNPCSIKREELQITFESKLQSIRFQKENE